MKERKALQKSELSNVLNPKRKDEQKVANYQVLAIMNKNCVLAHIS